VLLEFVDGTDKNYHRRRPRDGLMHAAECAVLTRPNAVRTASRISAVRVKGNV
jgi:hypothetical protein